MSVNAAQAEYREEDQKAVVALRGRWELSGKWPRWHEVLAGRSPRRVRFDCTELETGDSAMVLFLYDAKQWARTTGAYFDATGLSDFVKRRLDQMMIASETSIPFDRSKSFLTTVGLAAGDIWEKTRAIADFVGECVYSAISLAKDPRRFRTRDCLDEMQACGAMALPIVGLIAFLVGMTLAYTAAVILRQFGADIWVADLVGLSMVREMGALMTAIVLSGRTGAAFAARLGNMKAGEEIDALVTLGVKPIDFLVMPRLVALALMMPLLAMYANALGILGGMAVAFGLLDIPPTAYWVELQTAVDLSDVLTGLIKASTFGVLVGVSGCLRGLQADRSAAGVGQAATSAVVTAILLIVIADSLFAVLFNVLGI